MLVFTTPLLAQVNCVTTPDQLGPYFIENAPIITNDTLAPGVNDTARALQLTFYVSSNCDTVNFRYTCEHLYGGVVARKYAGRV